MNLTIFNENDNVLLVGEGNFSFSVALFHLHLKINIIATCYESKISQDLGKKNIEYLKNNGIHVLLGVDATSLKQHPILKTELFDKIIFNFPHVGGKMRIEKNRELLKQFFINASESLKDNGQILVTLCNGQGGTCIDNPPRHWNDSWKITEMAAYGNFILRSVESFAWSSFQDYVVTGYRSMDKQFHSSGALTHIFVKSESPNVENIVPKKKLSLAQYGNSNFSWKNIINVYAHTYEFDITFSVNKEFDPIKFNMILYNHAGAIINNVTFIRSFTSPLTKVEKRTYRISYTSDCIPLYRKRVIDIHQNLIANILENNLNVSISR